MEKNEFTRKLAERMGSTHAAAADQLDTVVHELLRRLRAGKPATIPGLGTLLPKSGVSGSKSVDRTRKASR